MYFVSVIVPVYNSIQTIGSCLEALVAQSYPAEAYEIIVVDDGSTDETAKTVQQYPVQYLYQANRGPAAARNNGANQARGKIILFTDSDCLPDTDWIKYMIQPFEQNPDVMAVKGAYQTNQSKLVARFAQIEFEERFELLKKAPSIDMIDTYSAGFRKELFLEMEGFDVSFPVPNNEDTELSYRLADRGCRMVFQPEAFVYHLRHPDSVKRYAKLKFSRGYWRMVVYKRFPGKAIKDTYTPQTLKLQILFLYLTLAIMPIAFIWHLMLYVLLPVLLIFIIVCVPFILFAVRRDVTVALSSLFLLSLRAASIGAGTIWYLLTNLLKKN